MDKYHPALQWGLGIIYLLLIGFAIWKLGSWLVAEVLPLTPKKLAISSFALTLIPFSFLLLFSVAGATNAMHVAGALMVLSISISVLGLMVAGVWYLVAS